MHVKEIDIKNIVYNYYFDNTQKKKKETKYILINKIKNLVIYFTRLVHSIKPALSEINGKD